MHTVSSVTRTGTLVASLLLVVGCAGPKGADTAGPSGSFAGRWYKGNTHMHSWWSDGSHPPEMVIQWYKEGGYDFLAMSDHATLQDSDKWLVPTGGKVPAAEQYEKAFGPQWVEKRTENGQTAYRLKRFDELQRRFAEPDRFLMVPGVELNTSVSRRSVHLNCMNVRELIAPPSGTTMQEVMQGYADAVEAQQARFGAPMMVCFNHPNFGWALTAEELTPIRGTLFFEVFNGHPGVRNYGDSLHPSVERMWDIALTKRLAEFNLPMTYGLASDDAHGFGSIQVGKSTPGRGWIMVRARRLAWPDLHEAISRGDFYSSTGVVLKDIRFAQDRLAIEIEPRPGVSYRTQFIGTLAGFDAASKAPATQAAVTRIYSEDIGKVLSEQTGPRAEYQMTGREIYVRAKVISSAAHPNPFAAGDVEVAWIQPVRPAGSLK